jgi:hypothetical protein
LEKQKKLEMKFIGQSKAARRRLYVARSSVVDWNLMTKNGKFLKLKKYSCFY